MKPSADWKSWWPDDGRQEWLDESGEPVAGVLPKSIWPLKIRGQQIGTCLNLAELTVDSGRKVPGLVKLFSANVAIVGPSMTIWAFTSDGLTASLQNLEYSTP